MVKTIFKVELRNLSIMLSVYREYHQLVAVVCIIFTVANILVTAQIEFHDGDDEKLLEGSTCKFRHNNSLGICTRHVLCPTANWEYQVLHIAPTTCSLERSYALVCCFSGPTNVSTFPTLPPKLISRPEAIQRTSAYCNFIRIGNGTVIIYCSTIYFQGANNIRQIYRRAFK